MKKFNFKIEKLLRQRKIEADIAQKDYLEAQKNLNDQLQLIQFFYSEVDAARQQSADRQIGGGDCLAEIDMLEKFLAGQKVRIEYARQKARELMQISEEKNDILVEKMQAFKVIEKLKEKQKAEYIKNLNKKMVKDMDDMTTMRSALNYGYVGGRQTED